jgi:N-acetylmuramoyl-L-alanine amidase
MDMSRRLQLSLAGAIVTALMVAMTGVASAQDLGCKGDIVLDPGHGGTDTGAVNNAYGLTEKAENLEVASDLKTLLTNKDGYNVCMTRTTNDETLTNNERYTYANTTGARVLISIHMNGSSSSTADYTTTLFGKWRKDKELANTVFQSLSDLPSASGTGTIATKTPYSFASGVLLKSNMPATIAEMVFITNNKEADWLKYGRTMPDGTVVSRQQQIAQKLEVGIQSYLAPH